MKSSLYPNVSHKVALMLTAATVALNGLQASGQSDDALINKLVAKGILSKQEAEDLQKETKSDFSKAFSSKLGLPAWVDGIKLSGDFRGRYEGFYPEDRAFPERTRLRYRLRMGLTYELKDQLEVGFRLSSSEAASGFGGEPLGGNTTFTSNGSKKFLYIDQAYGKWKPELGDNWKAGLTIGKMENPFTGPSSIVFDKDYTPEGLAAEVSYKLASSHTLKLAGAGFALGKLGNNPDALVLGAQTRLDSQWSKKLSTSVGAALFSVSGTESLRTDNVPDIGRGNTRTAAGDLQASFNPIYTDASVTYTLDRFPFHTGAFPITVSGDYLHNPAASAKNNGYTAGLTLGKAGKKGGWDLGYRWVELQADAWWEELPESDFGAYYEIAAVGGKPGYASGTNVRGHLVRACYSPWNALTLGFSCYLTELIDEMPAGSNSRMTRLQLDATWKF
jgi:hypothetical protein